mgnify:CR=1 FL=1
MTTDQTAGALESGYIEGAGAPLYATFHGADDAPSRAVLVYGPFGEERKCAYGNLVQMSRRLAAAGFDVLRFDYSGTGDSGGDHGAATVEDWIADGQRALEYLKTHSRATSIVALGLRLGASLILHKPAPELEGAVLWEPLTSGRVYWEEMLRRRQIRAMESGAEMAEPEDEWAAGRPADFDGFAINRQFAEGLQALDLVRDMDGSGELRILTAHISGGRTMSAPWDGLEYGDGTRRLISIRDKPFWGMPDERLPEELVEETLEFCGGERKRNRE